MSQQNVERDVEVVRRPLRIRDGARRALDQRLCGRFPRLATALARWGSRLPPTSRIRQAATRRGARLGVEAFNRRDFAALFLISHHPEAEFYAPRELADSGMVKPRYRGYEGYEQFFREWLGAWGDYTMRPKELIDAGDRLVILDEIVGRGAVGGTPITREHAIVMFLKDGKVVLQREYFDPAEALQAVGLSE